MNLTRDEQRILEGKQGEGRRVAMELVVKFGRLYQAQRLVEVKNAHIDAGAYSTIWDSGLDFVESLVQKGARVAVPTTINPCSHDQDNWQRLGQPEEFVRRSHRLKQAYLRLGVSPTWTCAPYECTSAPSFGEVVSWSESNAVNYLNSVLGARSNRLPDLVDVCCAVAGRVPEYGLLLPQQRAGQLLFELREFPDPYFRDASDYAVLGYLVGEIAGSRVPVVLGLPQRTTKADLKAFSAASASSGAVALFHAVGHTPESPSLEAAFQGRRDYESYVVTPRQFQEVKERLTVSRGQSRPGLGIILGCPHLSFSEIAEIHALFRGQRTAPGVEFWIQTSRTVCHLLEEAGLRSQLEEAGALLIKDTCVLELSPLTAWPFGTIVTNSGKIAQYGPGVCGVGLVLASTAQCVQAAISGRVEG